MKLKAIAAITFSVACLISAPTFASSNKPKPTPSTGICEVDCTTGAPSFFDMVISFLFAD
jgi:hypothetical protein